MNFNCEIDNVKTLKKGMKITLSIKDENTIYVMKHIYNFIDKPLNIELLIDKDEQLERMNEITKDQRRKIFAILKDIASYTGDNVETLRENISQSFIQATEYEQFSLSNCSKELAKDFIEYLLVLSFELGVQLTEDPKKDLDDLSGYLRLCINKKICCICGKPHSDIHHVETVGMGRDRTKINDDDNKKMCLCREHHTEYHKIGQEDFEDKYHVYGVEVSI